VQRFSPPAHLFYFPCSSFFLCAEKAFTLPALSLLLSKDLFVLSENDIVWKVLTVLKFLTLAELEFLTLTDVELAEI